MTGCEIGNWTGMYFLLFLIQQGYIRGQQRNKMHRSYTSFNYLRISKLRVFTQDLSNLRQNYNALCFKNSVSHKFCIQNLSLHWRWRMDIFLWYSDFTKFDLEINKLSTNMLWCLLLILEVLLKSNQCWIEHEILQFTIQYISFHLKLVWHFSWVYWSVYAGREKWLFYVIFLKVGPLCDQTWWESPVFQL